MDHITWDEYFMGIALFSAQRSKDPNTKVGACIVNSDKKIVGIGYNGMPTGCFDYDMPWERTGDTVLDTKYPFVCHAELNAILNSAQTSLRNCTLYATLFPCNECAKAIIQSGIKRVVYYDNKYADTESAKASCILFEKCDIKFDPYKPTNRSITLSL